METNNSDALHDDNYKGNSSLTDKPINMLETECRGNIQEVKPLLLFSRDDACKLKSVSTVPSNPNILSSVSPDEASSHNQTISQTTVARNLNNFKTADISATSDPIKTIANELEVCYSTNQEAQQNITESSKSASDIVKSMIKDFKKSNSTRCSASDIVKSLITDMKNRNANTTSATQNETNCETKTVLKEILKSKEKWQNTTGNSPVTQNPEQDRSVVDSDAFQSQKTKQPVAPILKKTQAKNNTDRYLSERSQTSTRYVLKPTRQPERLKSTVPSILRKPKPKQHWGTVISKQSNQSKITAVESERNYAENKLPQQILKRTQNNLNVIVPTKTESASRKSIRRIRNAKCNGMVVIPNPSQPVPNGKIILFSESFQHDPSESFCKIDTRESGDTASIRTSSKTQDQKNQQCRERHPKKAENHRKTEKSQKVLPVPILPKPSCQLDDLSQTHNIIPLDKQKVINSEQSDRVKLLHQTNPGGPYMSLLFPSVANETEANNIHQNPVQILSQPQLLPKPSHQASSVILQQLLSPNLHQLADVSLNKPSTVHEQSVAPSGKQYPRKRSFAVFEDCASDISVLKHSYAGEVIQQPTLVQVQKSPADPLYQPCNVPTLQQSYSELLQKSRDVQLSSCLPEVFLFSPLPVLNFETTLLQRPIDTSSSSYSRSQVPLQNCANHPLILEQSSQTNVVPSGIFNDGNKRTPLVPVKDEYNDIPSNSEQKIPKNSCITFNSADSKIVEKTVGNEPNELNLVVESVYSLAQDTNESLENLRQNKWYVKREKSHFVSKFKRNLKLYDVKNCNDFKDLRLYLPCFVVLESLTDIQGHLQGHGKSCTFRCRQSFVKNMCTKMAKRKILRRKHNVKKEVKRINRKDVRNMKCHTQSNCNRNDHNSFGMNISARDIMTLLQNVLYINMLIGKGISNKPLPTDIKELIRLFPTISDDKGNTFRQINIANNSILINANELESGNLAEILKEKLTKKHSDRCSPKSCKTSWETSSERSFSSDNSSVIESESSYDDTLINEFSNGYYNTNTSHNSDPNDPTGLISKHTYYARSSSPWSDISDCTDNNGSSTETIPYGMSATSLQTSTNRNTNSQKITFDEIHANDSDSLSSRNTSDFTLMKDSHWRPSNNLGKQSSRSLSLENIYTNVTTDVHQQQPCDQDLVTEMYRQKSRKVSLSEASKPEDSVEEVTDKSQTLKNSFSEFFKDRKDKQVEKSSYETNSKKEDEECSEHHAASSKIMNLSSNLNCRKTILDHSQTNESNTMLLCSSKDVDVDTDIHEQRQPFYNLRDRNTDKAYIEDSSCHSSSSSEDMNIDIMTKMYQCQSGGKNMIAEMFKRSSHYLTSNETSIEQQSVEVAIEKIQDLRNSFHKLFMEIKDKQTKCSHKITGNKRKKSKGFYRSSNSEEKESPDPVVLEFNHKAVQAILKCATESDSDMEN